MKITDQIEFPSWRSCIAVAGLELLNPRAHKLVHARNFRHHRNTSSRSKPARSGCGALRFVRRLHDQSHFDSFVDGFNGYDTPPAIPSVTGGLNVVQLPVLLPFFTVRQVVTTVNIWDNQTVVLGGLVSSEIDSTKGQNARSWATCRWWDVCSKASQKNPSKKI